MGSYDLNTTKKSAAVIILLALLLLNSWALKENIWYTKSVMEKISDVSLFSFNILWLCQYVKQLKNPTKEINIPDKIFVIYRMFLIIMCAFCIVLSEITTMAAGKTEPSSTTSLISIFLLSTSVYLFLYSVPSSIGNNKQGKSYIDSYFRIIELFVLVLLLFSLVILTYKIYVKGFTVEILFDFILVCFNVRWLFQLLVGNKSPIKGSSKLFNIYQSFSPFLQLVCIFLFTGSYINGEDEPVFSIYQSIILALFTVISYLQLSDEQNDWNDM